MRKGTIDEVKEAWEQIKEERERYYKKRELKKQGINPRDNSEYENKERGVREVSSDTGDVERTVTSHSPTNETAAYRSREGTYIFGKKYVKGDKSSRIRLVILLVILAAVVAFFIIMGILGSQQQ